MDSARAIAISADGKAAQVLVRAHINAADITDQKTLISGLERALASAHPPPGVRLALAGAVATNVANQASSQRTGSETQTVSFIFIIVLLLLIFRSVLAPLITLLPAGISLVVSMRLIGELGAHGLKISEITELLLIILILGAGTDYGLFLVFRVREEIRRGVDDRAAVEHALVRVGESITASAATVIIALLTLLLASFGIYHDLGIPLAIGVAMILLAGLTLLPALLAIFGKAAFWPTHVKPGEQQAGVWGRVAARVIHRPALTLALGLTLFGALAAVALGYHSSGFGGAANAPKGSTAATGNALVSAHFPQSSSNPANLVFSYAKPVWEEPHVISRAEHSLKARGSSPRCWVRSRPTAPRSAPRSSRGCTRCWETPRRCHPRLPPTPPFRLGIRRLPLQCRLRRTGRARHPVRGEPARRRAADHGSIERHAADSKGGRAGCRGLGGERVRRGRRGGGALRRRATSNNDLINIIPVAIVAIALLLALVLRSLVAPLYLIISVALSYLAALGVATLVFIDIGGEGGLTFILPFLMFIFLLALGEDYNILVMTRIREEARSMPLTDAVVEAVARTGTTVTSAGLVLAGTFGVLAVVAGSSASGSQVSAIGSGLAIGILMDTFIVRTLLVPATVTLLGRWNWWPSAMSRAPAEATRSASS